MLLNIQNLLNNKLSKLLINYIFFETFFPLFRIILLYVMKMVDQLNLNYFNIIYEETYTDILKFIVIKCSNIDDVNDILQETYLEFWKILQKKELNDKNIKSYIMGIALNKVRKHYSFIYKLNIISLFQKDENDRELIETFHQI